jgi:hypothetical protein
MEMDKLPIIYLRDVSFVELECLVQFIYSGKTSVPGASLASFLQLAHSLGVKGFTDGKVGSSPPAAKKKKKPDGGGGTENVLLKHTISEPAYPAGRPGGEGEDSPGTNKRKKLKQQSLDEMTSPAKRNDSTVGDAERKSRSRPPPPPYGETTPYSDTSLHGDTSPKTPLSPLTLPSFWSNTPLNISVLDDGAQEKENKENSVFKKPFTPPPPPAMLRHISTVSCPVAEEPLYQNESASATAAANFSFDASSSSSAMLDPNELAAKGATLLHHLAMWMIEEKKMEEEKEVQVRLRQQSSATLPAPVTTASTSSGRRSLSLLSGGERPDSGFDSKDEATSASTPTKEGRQQQQQQQSQAEGAGGGGGGDNSSPEESAEMSRKAPIRQPVLRKRRMNFLH